MKSQEKLTFGDRVADYIAKFGGSWAAIFSCVFIIIIWIWLNTCALHIPIDPFPYILLNLFLSCVAALQAPFILMANARQQVKDRACAEEDLAIDKKAEKEICEILRKIEQLQNSINRLR